METKTTTPTNTPAKPKPTHVYFIVDESGSMSSYTQGVRQSIGNIIEGNTDPNVRHTIITFSNTVDYATDVSKLKRPEHQNTSIAPAFRKMFELLNATPARRMPERVVIAFISDGIDTDHTKGIHNIKCLPRLPMESVLFTIGVGDDFPTSLVVDSLRPKYHSGSAALPLVLPVSSQFELPWAFGQLESLLMAELQNGTPIPDRVTQETSTRDMIGFVRGKYNECIVLCAQSARSSAKENLALLTETYKTIHAVATIAKDRLKEERSEQGAERIKPLLSNLMRTTVYSAKSCVTLCVLVITRLNEMIANASKGQLISELPDCAKKELIGYAYTEGKLMHVATKYRAANFGTTKQSLLRLLKDYAPKELDRSLQDPINLSDQAEYFEDARDNLLDLIPFTHTLPGILHMLPFVCRTLTLKEPVPLDALQMNEWLAEVAALPMVHRTMTTYDFYERYKCAFSAREEAVNSLLVLGHDQNSSGIFHHVQSMLLLRHPGLFVLTARLALAGSVLAHILCCHKRHEGWMDQELSMVEGITGIYTRQNLQSWHAYLDDMRSNDLHRRCLVPESPKVPQHCRCPGLTKYLLALYTTIKGTEDAPPRAYTPEELSDRHHALVVEFLSRCRISLFDAFEHTPPMKAGEYLQEVWDYEGAIDRLHGFEGSIGEQILAASLTLKEARDRFADAVRLHLASNETRDQDRIIVATTFIPPKSKVYQLQHYQLTLKRINTAFARLGALCGHKQPLESHPLDRYTLVRALHTAHFSKSAVERCESPAITSPFPRDELRDILGTHFARLFKNAVLGRADDFVAVRFNAHHIECHGLLARPIPPAYVERFWEEFGLDIGTDWGLNSSGLSTLACCSPECSHYLDLLEAPPAGISDQTASNQPSSNPPASNPPRQTSVQASNRRICKTLRLHLDQARSTLSTVQGFHKTVSSYQNLAPHDLTVKISLGECLCDPFPARKDLRLQTAQAFTKTAAQTREEWKQLEIKQAMLLQSKIIERKHEMLHALQRAVEARSGGEPDFLIENVKRLQREMQAPSWSYEDFRDLFILKYKKHQGLLAAAAGGRARELVANLNAK